jgi:c(7)-type cytochrome triheme protein
MKKFIVLAMVAVFTFVVSASAIANMKPVEFNTPAGKVVWDNKTHLGKGLKCTDCHEAIFKKKVGGNKATMKDMEAGKSCGACHNGTKAFGVKDAADCAKCHKK